MVESKTVDKKVKAAKKVMRKEITKAKKQVKKEKAKNVLQDSEISKLKMEIDKLILIYVYSNFSY